MTVHDAPKRYLFLRLPKFLCEQLELEGILRISARRKEQEQVRRETSEDLAEDLFEGEKADTVGELAQQDTPMKKKFQRNFSELTVSWSDENKEKKLYIVLIRSYTAYFTHWCHSVYATKLQNFTEFLYSLFYFSLHGLVRGDNMELGRDSDTGGQVKHD